MRVKITIASAAAIITILGGALMGFTKASEQVGQYTKQIQMNSEAVKELKGDVKEIISRTDKIGTDIEWIKETLRNKL